MLVMLWVIVWSLVCYSIVSEITGKIYDEVSNNKVNKIF